MSETRVPTDNELFEIAEGICNFARNETERRGYEWAFSLVAVMLAGEAAGKFIRLIDVLGVDGVRELGNAIKEMMVNDMLSQAEDILRGDAE